MGLLGPHIRRFNDASAEVQVLPWEIDQVVSIRGAWNCPASFDDDSGVRLDVMAALLDKGTASKSKIEIAEQLERIGASISFSARGSRIHVSARCLAGDLSVVSGLIREQLIEPSFPDRELELLKGRLKAQIVRQQSDPGAVCRNWISRIVYPLGHPSRELALQDLLAELDGVDRSDIVSLHASPQTFDGMQLAVVGDVDQLDPGRLAGELNLKPDGAGLMAGIESPSTLSSTAQRHHEEIPDRVNLNVLMGQPVAVSTTDDRYLPIWAGVFVLGGNFSSRLMSTVRDERGLTYGIRSYLSGMDADRTGAWMTSVTLSQDKLEEGIECTMQVIQDLLRTGVSSDELEERIQTLTGSYEVELATTGGVASRLMSNMLRRREPNYIDLHPSRVRALTRDEVNEAIRSLLEPEKLAIITAGTR